MKLSVVIICWNDSKVILDCIGSVYEQTGGFDYEIIVADNASADGSVEAVKSRFPNVRIVQNPENGGFGKGNNAGIREALGEYVLILNPDTIIRNRAIEKLVAYAERFPEAGALGCRILNVDGSVQLTAHPLPTRWTSLVKALALRWPSHLFPGYPGDSYPGWDGARDRSVGFLAGCCILARGPLLQEFGGFDERFFHQFEDADLCRRIWDSGHPVMFFAGAEITHIGGQARGTYSIPMEIEIERNRYRYFDKYYGLSGVRWTKAVSLLGLGIRYGACRVLGLLKKDQSLENKRGKFLALLKWHWKLDPVRFVQTGKESPAAASGPEVKQPA
jgi:GT2 family glycosyltransferase